MAPRMKLPQRRKSTRALEEEQRKKAASTPDPAPAPTPSASLVTPSKKPLSGKKIALERNIDFHFLEKDGFTFGEKIKSLG
ncbi:hypothetical protein COCNU_scaffold004099G000040 [Cocos nucifera]|nr:hypothetical protein [Cocos nucifera]